VWQTEAVRVGEQGITASGEFYAHREFETQGRNAIKAYCSAKGGVVEVDFWYEFDWLAQQDGALFVSALFQPVGLFYSVSGSGCDMANYTATAQTLAWIEADVSSPTGGLTPYPRTSQSLGNTWSDEGETEILELSDLRLVQNSWPIAIQPGSRVVVRAGVRILAATVGGAATAVVDFNSSSNFRVGVKRVGYEVH